jgi:hypothetical protein
LFSYFFGYYLKAREFEESQLTDIKDVSIIKTYDEKYDGIMKMISRDRMKVVFFGR